MLFRPIILLIINRTISKIGILLKILRRRKWLTWLNSWISLLLIDLLFYIISLISCLYTIYKSSDLCQLHRLFTNYLKIFVIISFWESIFSYLKGINQKSLIMSISKCNEDENNENIVLAWEYNHHLVFYIADKGIRNQIDR